MIVYRDKDILVNFEEKHIASIEGSVDDYEIRLNINKFFIGEDVLGLMGEINRFILNIKMLMKL